MTSRRGDGRAWRRRSHWLRAVWAASGAPRGKLPAAHDRCDHGRHRQWLEPAANRADRVPGGLPMRDIACLPTRKCPAIALSLAAIVLTAFLPAQPAPARTAGTAAQLDHLVHRFARAHPSFPGVALAARTPKLSWAGVAGVADRATRKPLSANAGFRIASVTKTFTAAAILR